MGTPRFRDTGMEYYPVEVIGRVYYNDVLVSTKYWPAYTNWLYKRHWACADELHSGPPYKEGGPLCIVKAQNELYHSSLYDYKETVTKRYRYIGKFAQPFPSNLNALWLDFNTESNWSAESLGPTAWNRFRPVKPMVDLGQFFAELRDFKSMFKFRLKSFKDMGGNYLNAVFGWRPFISDLIKWYESIQKVDRIVRFVRKNNNKWITRRGSFPSEKDTVVSYAWWGQTPTLPTYFYNNSPPTSSNKAKWPDTTITTTTSTRVWFEARWKFYIRNLETDPATDVINSRLLRHLYGLELTPSLCWELTPWSWLADWFGNVGDNMSNFSAQCYDNLVAKYAYIMKHRKSTVHYKTEWTYPVIGRVRTEALTTGESKSRVEASPFGFNLDWAEFSPYQVAILAALGISRLG